MEITPELVEKVAALSRLHIDESRKQTVQAELQQMIAFVDKLNELDTGGVEPLLHMSLAVNVLREDTVQGSIPRETAFQNAPVHDNTYFKVPKVIRK